MFQERVFLPTAGVSMPLKSFDWTAHHMAVQQKAEPFPSNRPALVAVNSFGIGGSYGHVILREWRVSSNRHFWCLSPSHLSGLPA
jgi:acyl transferase domain-containing protein